ncbi:uracil-DNA glycosylase [Suttonella ornithocola]
MQTSLTITPDSVRIESGWKIALAAEFSAPYFAQIKQTLLSAKAAGETVYPPGKLIFNAFDTTPFAQTKVVIIGQDPYHGAGQAMGLSFSVPKGVRVPPSLQNIYKELQREYPDFTRPPHGDLTAWAKQGVLLLNASLTVLAGKAGSHSKIGWQQFTDAAIRALSKQKEHLVFMLWGNFAKAKANLIDTRKHCILTAVHPSPLAGGAFIGCNHFSLANDYLQSTGQTPIDWRIA